MQVVYRIPRNEKDNIEHLQRLSRALWRELASNAVYTCSDPSTAMESIVEPNIQNFPRKVWTALNILEAGDTYSNAIAEGIIDYYGRNPAALKKDLAGTSPRKVPWRLRCQVGSDIQLIFED